MNERSIRPLVESDISKLQAIDAEAHGEQWSRRAFLDQIRGADRRHLVIEHETVVVGHAAAWIDGSVGRIINVAVDTEHVGRGHGRALVFALINSLLQSQGVSSLQLEVRAANRRAQRLYSRFGFVPVGIERDFYDRSDSSHSRDALIMVVADVCASDWRERLAQVAADQNPGAAA